MENGRGPPAVKNLPHKETRSICHFSPPSGEGQGCSAEGIAEAPPRSP